MARVPWCQSRRTRLAASEIIDISSRNHRAEGRKWGCGGGTWGLWFLPRCPAKPGFVTHRFRYRPRFKEFCRSVFAYVKGAKRQLARLKDPNRRIELLSEIVDVVATAGRLADALYSHFRADLIERGSGAPPTDMRLEHVEPASILKMPDNICLLGDAGAGKTCIARVLAEVSLGTEAKCVYFPCSRIQDSETPLDIAIVDFLSSINALEPGTSFATIKRNADLIILDGCDEAATYRTRLASDLLALSFSNSSVTLPFPISANYWIPDDLIDAFTVTLTKRNRTATLEISDPINSSDWRRVIRANRGTPWEKAFERLQLQVANASPRIIVTSREAEPLELPRTFGSLRVLPFNDEQLVQFFERWFRGASRKSEEVISFLEANPRVREICRTPMTATIVAAIHEKELPLPQSRTDIYRTRFALLLERWDPIRKVVLRARLMPGDKMTFLVRMALLLQKGHRREFGLADADKIWREGLSRTYPDVSVQELLSELRSVDNVIFHESRDRYSLGHLSYQEYLAANGVALGQHIGLLVKNVFDPWWRQVALFYAGITGDITKFLRRLGQQDLRPHRAMLDEMLIEARHTSSFARTIITEIIREP